MLKQAVSEAAASEETTRTGRYVKPPTAARTKPAACFSILPAGTVE
jgi:hypothetical protein